MVNAVLLSLSEGSFQKIPEDRYLDVYAKASDHGSWIGVDYLILCTQFSPVWVAKIDIIALPRIDGAPLRVSFCEIRSIDRQRGHPDCPEELKHYRHNGGYARLLSFETDAFFTIGEPVPFIVQPDILGAVSLEKGAELIARTYGVQVDQVDITIRSKSRLG
ncbi:hypothetical protein [Pseudomonas sp. 3HC3]|uniref:hypothetical protein n=1 Tax=Pseudomonas sp. 3HC3 TaxID=2781025 RepID=UPI00383D977C